VIAWACLQSNLINLRHAKTIERHRSAKTGKYVTEKHAKSHPSTTVTERDKVPTKKGKK